MRLFATGAMNWVMDRALPEDTPIESKMVTKAVERAQTTVEQKNAEGHVEQVLRIDSRPSDGIAIAVRVGCPIYAAEEVMDMAAQDASVLGGDSNGDDEEAEDFEEE